MRVFGSSGGLLLDRGPPLGHAPHLCSRAASDWVNLAVDCFPDSPWPRLLVALAHTKLEWAHSVWDKERFLQYIASEKTHSGSEEGRLGAAVAVDDGHFAESVDAVAVTAVAELVAGLVAVIVAAVAAVDVAAAEVAAVVVVAVVVHVAFL